ncbi:hypothetical protein M8C21_025110, partial [Ambrosia artemisiifolia]
GKLKNANPSRSLSSSRSLPHESVSPSSIAKTLLFLITLLLVKISEFEVAINEQIKYGFEIVSMYTHKSLHDFFFVLHDKLSRMEEVTELQPIPDAHVQSHENLRYISDVSVLYDVDEPTIRSLNGCRVADQILKRVPNVEEKDETKVDVQPTGEVAWEERLSDEYTKIVERIDEPMTQKEIYFLLREGVYISNSQQVFVGSLQFCEPLFMQV